MKKEKFDDDDLGWLILNAGIAMMVLVVLSLFPGIIVNYLISETVGHCVFLICIVLSLIIGPTLGVIWGLSQSSLGLTNSYSRKACLNAVFLIGLWPLSIASFLLSLVKSGYQEIADTICYILNVESDENEEG